MPFSRGRGLHLARLSQILGLTTHDSSPHFDISAEISQGFVDGIEYLAETLAPTPAPTPAPIPELTPAPLPAASSTEDDSGGSTFTTVYLDDDRFSSSIPETPAPVVLPAIRVNVETEAYDYCPRIPLSNLTIDWEGVESGDVRSLHASVYVSEPELQARLLQPTCETTW